MRFFPFVLGACALFAAWQYVTGRPIEHAPGALVESEPQQSLLNGAQPIEFKGVLLRPRAEFKAGVRVLGRSRYRIGKLADVAPLDIAAGWGGMSDSSVLKNLDISQSNRFYYWRYEDEPPIPEAQIERQSANWHLIPSTSLEWRTLEDLRVGDVVMLEGRLVDIDGGEDIGVMSTSLSREDTGAGACEILFVEAARIRRR